jgi:predicted PhzF superfamily epimerase YddE/YHI9
VWLVNYYAFVGMLVPNYMLSIGHATLAAAHTLLTQYYERENFPQCLTFQTLSGDLRVTPKFQPDQKILLEMDFPLGDPQPIDLSNVIEPLLLALGLESSDLPSATLFCGKTKKLLLRFEKIEPILQCSPSSSRLLEVTTLFSFNARRS